MKLETKTGVGPRKRMMCKTEGVDPLGGRE